MLNFDDLLDMGRNTKFTPFLVSKPGIGKTMWIESECKKRNLKLFKLNSSTIEAPELSLQVLSKDGKVEYTPPAWHRDADVVLIDEVDRIIDKSVESGLLTAIWDRSLNGSNFKKNMVFIACGNQEHDEVNTRPISEGAFADRFIRFNFEITHKEHVQYLEEKYGFSPMLSFYETKSSLFDGMSRRRCDLFVAMRNNETVLRATNAKLFNAYKAFISEKLYTLDDVLKSGDAIVKDDNSANLSVVNDYLCDLTQAERWNKKEISNWVSFIKKISAESKAAYFSKLRRLVNVDEKHLKIMYSLNDLDFFDGQKKFLEGLL